MLRVRGVPPEKSDVFLQVFEYSFARRLERIFAACTEQGLLWLIEMQPESL
jgi:hypothetical protein